MYYPYFRGKQYELITIRETSKLLAEKNFVPVQRFDKLTYWNHDLMPSTVDTVPRCFEYLDMVSTIHHT